MVDPILETAEADAPRYACGENDDAAEIRYSLTALGEALVRERTRPVWHGFGPCAAARRPQANTEALRR